MTQIHYTKILPQELAMDIYNCHSEIIRANKLLDEVNAFLNKDNYDDTQALRDCFGRQQNNLQLGIPSGESSRQILQLSPKLGKYIIEAHLAAMENSLKELSLAASLALKD